MPELKTDLIVRLDEEGKSFKLFLCFLFDDGAIASVRVKNFFHKLEAKDLQAYTADWQHWRIADKSEMALCRELRDKKKTEEVAS